MSIGLIFWILMLIWFLFSVWWYWPPAGAPAAGWGVWPRDGFIWVLLLLIGWAVFGAPVRG